MGVRRAIFEGFRGENVLAHGDMSFSEVFENMGRWDLAFGETRQQRTYTAGRKLFGKRDTVCIMRKEDGKEVARRIDTRRMYASISASQEFSGHANVAFKLHQNAMLCT